MKRKYLLFIAFILLLLSISSPSYAYLDPGSGSVMLQGLFAGFVGIIAVLKLYWRRILQFFKRKPPDVSEVHPENHHDNT